ncbi:uncharacterized protein N7477_002935 [Penicillium maclennaniae]|uniref:uncharacterized protein n=1 Tax=Penicillium maclennaniae TaxID=1343394 RepID=UPI002540FA96|nr:uncharacterized protein N7477_002935 [Penicillium maclennaniae]KAJ5677302.1 hypothetical protein N7477_002935 [Penicillium maclennaniae]
MQASLVAGGTKIWSLKRPGPLNIGASADSASKTWDRVAKIHHDFTFENFRGVIDFPSGSALRPQKYVAQVMKWLRIPSRIYKQTSNELSATIAQTAGRSRC